MFLFLVGAAVTNTHTWFFWRPNHQPGEGAGAGGEGLKCLFKATCFHKRLVQITKHLPPSASFMRPDVSWSESCRNTCPPALSCQYFMSLRVVRFSLTNRRHQQINSGHVLFFQSSKLSGVVQSTVHEDDPRPRCDFSSGRVVGFGTHIRVSQANVLGVVWECYLV